MVKLTQKEIEAKRKNLDDIPKIFAVIRPDDYASNAKEVKKVIEKEGRFVALNVAKGKAEEEHQLIYDSASETLEPIYFWILDLMNKNFSGDVKKIVDNFTSTPGSGHFSELQGKATHMQGEVSKILGNINIVIKSIINIVYDLKDFQVRLSHYDATKSNDKQKALAGLLALKQVWLDTVDMKRGNGSIHAMTQQLGFTTLRDAFMSVNTLEEANKLDLNERVKRVLIPRFQEFMKWKELSGIELRKRYNLERTYLKSQIESLKLYARWAKPYLRAASQLEMKSLDDPALVSAFNTILFQLILFGKRAISVEDLVNNNLIPEKFAKIKMRKYYYCVVVDFYFRGIPQKAGQHYTFGGRSEVTFRGYALNEDEMKMFEKMLEESDINEVLALAEGITSESLGQLKEDLDYFLKEEQEQEQSERKSDEDVNPFSALFSFAKKEKNKSSDSRNKKENKAEESSNILSRIKEDKHSESVIRAFARQKAKETCFSIFNVYKKAHGMANYPSPYE